MPVPQAETSRRFLQAFFGLSLAITLVKLSDDRGGGDAFFTLLGLVLASTVAPYWLSFRAMTRWPGWAAAIGAGALSFGIIDVAVRMQAFYFPSLRSDGRMALWLPLLSLVVVPGGTLVARGLTGRGRVHKHEGPA